MACLAMVSGRTYADVRASFGAETLATLRIESSVGGLSDHAIMWWLNREGYFSRRWWTDGEYAKPAATTGLCLALTHDAHWVVVADGAVLDPARETPLPSYRWRQFIEVLPPNVPPPLP